MRERGGVVLGGWRVGGGRERCLKCSERMFSGRKNGGLKQLVSCEARRGTVGGGAGWQLLREGA